jgi:uncharacterized protein
MTEPTVALGTGPAVAAIRSDRLVGPDVTRAIALIGVVVMNYHGYLNGASAQALPGSGFGQRLFDPWEGVLSTRFAATFVLVAGVGVTLLTNRSRTTADQNAIRADRWRLVRRGTLLYAVGFVLDWIWPGTILFYYGAMFVIAALLFTLRSRWLILIGAIATVAAAAIRWWAAERALDGDFPGWLLAPQTLETTSPRGLLLDTFVNGTHPLFPWLAFLCAGMVLGRHLRLCSSLRLAAAGIATTGLTYLVNHVMTNGQRDRPVRLTVLSTTPFDRGLLYVAGTLGTSIAALCTIGWVAERWRNRSLTGTLQAAGQMTLSIYVAHVLAFNGIVHWGNAVGATGLDTALAFAACFWLVAITVAAWWRRFVGLGPLERVYRSFGG